MYVITVLSVFTVTAHFETVNSEIFRVTLFVEHAFCAAFVCITRFVFYTGDRLLLLFLQNTLSQFCIDCLRKVL